MNKTYAFQNTISGEDIKALRHTLKLTQADFSELVGVSKKTIERWESGKEEITGPITRVVRLLWENNQIKDRYEVPAQTLPLRLAYYCRDMLCTVIDVDDINQQIKICNFTGKYQYRAFGANEWPTYDEYQEFLESRCFPRTRDKMKLILEDLNLPFNDLLMIIEKTGGRMAEDDFRLEVIRL